MPRPAGQSAQRRIATSSSATSATAIRPRARRWSSASCRSPAPPPSRAGNRPARGARARPSLPLARQLASRYQRAEEPLEDLVQVASLGLIKAIDRFDPERDIAFSSYAVPTILGELKRHFRDRTWAVRVPRDLQELSLKVDRAVAELSKQSHKSPSVTEIARHVGASEEQVLEALEASGAYRAT